MTEITCKCPTCGAYQQVPSHLAQSTATCLKCGAVYVPEDNMASAKSQAEKSASAADIRQIAADVKFMADHLRKLCLLGNVLIVLWLVSAVLSFLGGCSK